MRKTVAAVVVAMGATATFAASNASATVSEANGVFFVHGTGDFSAPTSAIGARTPSGGTAISGYWTQSSLDTMVAAPQGGSWSYGVSGHQGGTTDAMTSWGVIADQLYDYYYSGNNGQIYNVVVVTHSNGSNPLRYLVAHPTATTPKGRTASTVASVIKKMVFVAGDNAGTPLADKVTCNGCSAANIGNDILSFLGGGNYNNAAVRQQVQSTMSSYNTNGTFAGGSTPGGISTNYIYGSNVYAAIWSGDAWCGGYPSTVGLKAAQIYGWGSSSAATDGFIGTNSSTYTGTAGNSGDSCLNHNQSRRSCHGVAGSISNSIHGALSGAFTAIPADYTISPGAQACNTTITGWYGTPGTQNYWYRYGCSSAMRTDASTDFDCYAAYGGDNGFVAPNDYGSTAYGNTSYYLDATNGSKTSSTGCSDSWLGDGTCDLCLVAKYGYDSASGQTADDDCVNAGAGTTNSCFDVAYDGYYSKVGYLSYTAVH